jgi:transposase
MSVVVGVDVGKQFHWAEIKLAETGQVLASHRVDNEPAAIATLIAEVKEAQGLHGPARVGTDMLGGIAGLLEAMLADARLPLVHVPGLVVNRARRATRGGEHKSDPRDARVIADQLRTRDDLRVIEPTTQLDASLRLLVARRSELVVDQTRRIARMRNLLCSIHPGLEAVIEAGNKADVLLLTRYVTPTQIRRAGHKRILEFLRRGGEFHHRTIDNLTTKTVASAVAQDIAVPGETVAAELIQAMAREILTGREHLHDLETRIDALLGQHPDAALVQTLPGMGATLTAAFLAAAGGIQRFPTGNELACAAGLAPILKQSGKTTFQHRPTGGDRTLKRVFYQSAFSALQRDPASRAFYDRKRAEGKRHHQPSSL